MQPINVIKTKKNIILIIAALSAFFAPFMGSALNIALPTIGNEFKLNAVLLSWVATSYLLSAAIFLLPCGKLADIYGRKKIFLIGIIIYTIFSTLCAVAHSGIVLIIFRVFQGLGASMMFGTGTAIIMSFFSPGERGKALGINVAGVYLGLSLGPFLGGIMTHAFGWRSIFIFNIPLGLFIIFLMLWKIKDEWIEAKEHTFDFWGALLSAISLTLLIYGASILNTSLGILIVSLGIITFILFIYYETQVQYPMLELKIFTKNRIFIFSGFATFIHYAATFGVGFLLSFYLQVAKNMSPREAGVVLVMQPLVMTIFSPFAGRLSDRFEARIVASVGMAITFVGIFMLIFLTNATSIIFILIALFIIGLGFAVFSSPNTNAILSSVEKKYLGVASATLGTLRVTGQMISMGITTLFFSLHIGKQTISQTNVYEFLATSQQLFVFFTIVCFTAIFTSFFSKNK